MAYRFGTSFDWLASGQLATGVFNQANNCFVSSNYMNCAADYAIKVLDQQQTWIFGCRYQANSPMNSVGVYGSLVSFWDDSTIQSTVLIANIGGALKFSVWRGNPVSGGTQIGSTSTLSILPFVDYDIEVKMKVANSGNCTVKVNNVTFVNENGDFAATANESANVIRVGSGIQNGSNPQFFYKWVYVLDTSGSLANDFLGPQLCTTIRPTGAGAHTDWTPNAGANWDRVDDTTADGDTTINTSTTANQIDTFVASDLPANVVTVNMASQWHCAKRGDADTIGISQVIRISGTDFVGSEDNQTASYVYYERPMSEDPNNPGNKFTKTVIDNCEIGYKLTTA